MRIGKFPNAHLCAPIFLPYTNKKGRKASQYEAPTLKLPNLKASDAVFHARCHPPNRIRDQYEFLYLIYFILCTITAEVNSKFAISVL